MELRCYKGCDKKCWVVLAVIVGVVLVGGLVYYFTSVYQPKQLTYADFDILCEDVDLSDEVVTAEREAKLQLIYDSPGFTEKELETMLPSGCHRVEKSQLEPGSCLVLEEKYCQELLGIEYQGTGALGLNIPIGASIPIFAPADGEYSDNQEYDTETLTKKTVIDEGEELVLLPTRITFRTPDHTSAIYFDSVFGDPSYSDGQIMSKGQILGYTVSTVRYLDEETQSNLVIIYSNSEMYKLIVPPGSIAEE